MAKAWRTIDLATKLPSTGVTTLQSSVIVMQDDAGASMKPLYLFASESQRGHEPLTYSGGLPHIPGSGAFRASAVTLKLGFL